jgi:hypothetical protein
MNLEKEGQLKEALKYLITFFASKSKRLCPNYDKIDQIFEYYNRYRNIVHRNMTETDGPGVFGELLMDHHKIAAVFLCSILKAKPLSYVPDGKVKAPNYLETSSNEQAGFLFALQILKLYRYDKAQEPDVSADDKEIYRLPFQFPECDLDDYLHYFVKLLNKKIQPYLNVEDKQFEENMLFYLSHIFFLLDSYSYQANKNILQADRLTREISELKRKEAISK